MAKKTEHKKAKKQAKRRASSKARKGGGGALYKAYQKRRGRMIRLEAETNTFQTQMDKLAGQVFGTKPAYAPLYLEKDSTEAQHG